MNNSLSSKLLLTKTIKKRKSSFGIDKVTSSKPYPKIISARKRNSVEVSRNFLLNKMPLILSQINNPNNTPKQKNLYRFQSSKLMKKEK